MKDPDDSHLIHHSNHAAHAFRRGAHDHVGSCPHSGDKTLRDHETRPWRGCVNGGLGSVLARWVISSLRSGEPDASGNRFTVWRINLRRDYPDEDQWEPTGQMRRTSQLRGTPVPTPAEAVVGAVSPPRPAAARSTTTSCIAPSRRRPARTPLRSRRPRRSGTKPPRSPAGCGPSTSESGLRTNAPRSTPQPTRQAHGVQLATVSCPRPPTNGSTRNATV